MSAHSSISTEAPGNFKLHHDYIISVVCVVAIIDFNHLSSFFSGSSSPNPQA